MKTGYPGMLIPLRQDGFYAKISGLAAGITLTTEEVGILIESLATMYPVGEGVGEKAKEMVSAISVSSMSGLPEHALGAPVGDLMICYNALQQQIAGKTMYLMEKSGTQSTSWVYLDIIRRIQELTKLQGRIFDTIVVAVRDYAKADLEHQRSTSLKAKKMERNKEILEEPAKPLEKALEEVRESLKKTVPQEKPTKRLVPRAVEEKGE